MIIKQNILDILQNKDYFINDPRFEDQKRSTERTKTMTNNRRKDPTPSETTEGKANDARTRAQEAARKAAEIRSRQRSLTNALLCCMI